MKLPASLTCLFLLLFLQSRAQQPSARDTVNVGIMTFEHNSHHFGDLVQGAKVSHVYPFKNTGRTPLVISNVLVTCGCTVPEWPKTPVLPGKSAEIRVFLNTAGKQGVQHKTITILANTRSGREALFLSATVLTPSK